jgi:hypothetical protein
MMPVSVIEVICYRNFSIVCDYDVSAIVAAHRDLLGGGAVNAFVNGDDELWVNI